MSELDLELAPDAILVPVTPPPAPYVLADSAYLAALADTEAKVTALKITDVASAQTAAVLLNELTIAGTKLEKARTAVKAPFLAICRTIDSTAEAPAKRIDATKCRLKHSLGQWQELQAAKAREAEAARQAELKRLEEQKRREDEEAARRAAEIAASAKAADGFDLEFEEAVPAPKTETEKKIEAMKFAPAVKPAAPTGIRHKQVLRLAKIEVTQLPDQFVIRTANERMLRETFCQGWKEGEPIPSVPGVTFEIQREVVSTGRALTPEF